MMLGYLCNSILIVLLLITVYVYWWVTLYRSICIAWTATVLAVISLPAKSVKKAEALRELILTIVLIYFLVAMGFLLKRVE